MKTLLLVATLALIGCSDYAETSVRPVTVKILNKETMKPLEGIPVYYSLHTKVFEKNILFFIPSIDPDVGPKIAYKSRATTNNNGEASFHARNFVLPDNERLEMESLVVNIDVDMNNKMARISKESLEHYYEGSKMTREGPVDNIDLVERYLLEDKKTRDALLYRPVAHYNGAVIRSQAYAPYEEGTVSDWFETGEHYSIAFSGDSMEMKSDLIIIELSRRDEVTEKGPAPLKRLNK